MGGENKIMPESNKPAANSLVVLREEFDDWAVLFDPDTGNAFGLNPVGVFIWKRLDGNHTAEEILKDLQESCEEIPDEAESHLKDFIQSLVEQGLAGYESPNNLK
jgi:SynChlorMet cassette protein ScmD